MEAKPNSRSRNRNDKTYSKDLIHDLLPMEETHLAPKSNIYIFVGGIQICMGHTQGGEGEVEGHFNEGTSPLLFS